MTFTARESAEVQLLFAEWHLQDVERQRNALVLSGASANTKGGVQFAGKKAGGSVGAGVAGAVNLFLAETRDLIEQTELDLQVQAAKDVISSLRKRVDDLRALEARSSTTLTMPPMWHRDP